MDLGNCPRCGADWRESSDKCHACGYVAIGAGVKATVKKKKRVRYSEPGSSKGLLTFLILVGAGYLGYQYYLERTSAPTLVGEWIVVKSIPLQPGQFGLISDPTVKGADMQFGPKGGVKLELSHEVGQVSAEGKYLESRDTALLKDLTIAEDPEVQPGSIPDLIKMNLVWSGRDTVYATVDGAEKVILKRKPGKAWNLDAFKLQRVPNKSFKNSSEMNAMLKGWKDASN